MELLKQPLGSPMTMTDQVITLVAASDHIFSDIEVAKVKDFQKCLLEEFAQNHSDIISQLASTKHLNDDLRMEIETIAETFKETWLSETNAEKA